MTLYSEVDKDDYLASLEKVLVLKKGSQRFPNNKEIKTALKEKDVYNIKSKNKVYFLELLENYNNREFVSIDNPDITIEHIFPRNPAPQWEDDLEEEDYNMLKDVYLHSIGNLTLSGNNGSLSNKPFLEKKEMNVDGKEQGYNYSRLWLNNYLKEIDKWNIVHLHNRFDKILKRFFLIWEYPSVDDIYQDESEELNVFEAENPRNKQLVYFVFRNEKVLTKQFSKMYYHVVENLFAENPQLFLNSKLKEQIQLSSDESQLRSTHKISDNYYIERNIDSNTKFSRLKKVLKAFGYEEELSLKYG